MDANFRLKNQLVSNYSQDPGLGIGWAFMVPRQSYEEYVLSRANDEDVGIYFSNITCLADSNFPRSAPASDSKRWPKPTQNFRLV